MKLSVENLACSFRGQMVLEQLNMQVKEREFVSILGPSGGGKSTLLNILAGVLKPDESCCCSGQGLSTHFLHASARFANAMENHNG